MTESSWWCREEKMLKLLTVKTVQACHPNRKLWRWEWNFGLKFWSYSMERHKILRIFHETSFFTNFVICFVDQPITLNLENKQNIKINVSLKIWKICWSFNLEFRSFNLKFHFSISKFLIRVSKLGALAWTVLYVIIILETSVTLSLLAGAVWNGSLLQYPRA